MHFFWWFPLKRSPLSEVPKREIEETLTSAALRNDSLPANKTNQFQATHPPKANSHGASQRFLQKMALRFHVSLGSPLLGGTLFGVGFKLVKTNHCCESPKNKHTHLEGFCPSRTTLSDFTPHFSRPGRASGGEPQSKYPMPLCGSQSQTSGGIEDPR